MIDPERLKEMDELISVMLSQMTKEDFDKYCPEDLTPKGWVDIEEALPQLSADDYFKDGYSMYKVIRNDE